MSEITFPVRIFSYGILQNAYTQKRMYGRTLAMQPDTVTGYKAFGTGIFTAWPTDGEKLTGHVIELQNDIELARTDNLEHGYNRVPVVTDSGVQAWLYVGKTVPVETGSRPLVRRSVGANRIERATVIAAYHDEIFVAYTDGMTEILDIWDILE